jgi:hypothetical protein
VLNGKEDVVYNINNNEIEYLGLLEEGYVFNCINGINFLISV